MLNYWKNGTTTLQNHERAIKMVNDAGIVAGGSFIFGGIDETLEEMKESFNWTKNALFYRDVLKDAIEEYYI